MSATALVDAGGLHALRWIVLPAVAVGVGVLVLLPRRLTTPPPGTHRPESIGGEVRHVFAILAERRRVMMPLWAMAAVRNLVVIGVLTLLSFHKAGGDGFELTRGVGVPMAVFTFSSGLGGVIYSWLRPKRRHAVPDSGRLLLWSIPLILLLPVLRLEVLRQWSPLGAEVCLWGVLAVCGGLVAATVPAVTALFQHLVPERENLAATLSMGLAWGAGGLIGPLLCAGVVQLAGEQTMGLFLGYGVVACVSVIGAILSHSAQAALEVHSVRDAKPAEKGKG
jgi:MFS family permease